jgi:hypothetical protein
MHSKACTSLVVKAERKSDMPSEAATTDFFARPRLAPTLLQTAHLVSIKAKKRRCSQIVAGADSREKELTATREFLEIYGRKNADTEA